MNSTVVTEIEESLKMKCPICTNEIQEVNFRFTCNRCHADFSRSNMRAYWEGYRDGKGWKHEGPFKKDDKMILPPDDQWDVVIPEMMKEAERLADLAYAQEIPRDEKPL